MIKAIIFGMLIGSSLTSFIFCIVQFFENRKDRK